MTLKRLLICINFTIWFLLIFAVISYTKEVTIGWDKSPDERVDGHNIYVERSYRSTDIDNNTITIDLEEGVAYTFHATATAGDNESKRSDNLTYTVPKPTCADMYKTLGCHKKD